MPRYYDDDQPPEPPENTTVDLSNAGSGNNWNGQPLPKWDDTTPMPFGMFKGRPLQDVPPDYLHWFYTTQYPSSRDSRALVSYIDRNLNALKMENRDLIWTKKK